MGDNSAGSKASFFLVGLGIGAMVGLLFAPKSGEDPTNLPGKCSRHLVKGDVLHLETPGGGGWGKKPVA